MISSGTSLPRRELVSLLAYVEMGSHKAAAYRLGISESTSRQRVSQPIRRGGASNAAQAIWRLGDAASTSTGGAAGSARMRPT